MATVVDNEVLESSSSRWTRGIYKIKQISSYISVRVNETFKYQKKY